jgi:protein-disulfide isomerase
MRIAKSFLKLLSWSIVAIALTWCVTRTVNAADAAAGKDQVAATVGSMKITAAEVDVKARPQLAAIQNQVYTVRKRTLDDMIDNYLIDQAAKKAGISRDAYLKREADDKAPAPTAQEMQDFYNKNKERIHQPFEKIKAPLEEYMKRQKYNAARAELLAKLRHDADVKVMLKAPRVEVSTESSAGSMGSGSAPITIVEFSDYQCPFCKQAEASVKEIVKKYGDKVRLVYMDFPLPMHPNALKSAQAARCAGDQGKYWEYHDALFADQSKLDDAGLKASAAKLKLDPKKFAECTAHDLHVDQIKQSQAEGAKAGVDGTPTFVINGRLMNGAQPASDMESLINEELASQNVKEAKAH